MWISGNLIINQCTSKKNKGEYGEWRIGGLLHIGVFNVPKPCFYSSEKQIEHSSLSKYCNPLIMHLFTPVTPLKMTMLSFVVHVLKNLIIHVLPLIFRHGKAPNALWRIPALSDSPTPQWATLWGHTLPHRQSTLPRWQPSVPTHGKHALSTKQCSLP